MGSKQKIKRKGGKIIGNRTRQFAYNFRASEQEKNLIDKAIAKSGLTMTAFVIRAITEKLKQLYAKISIAIGGG